MSNIPVTHCCPNPHIGETLTVNYLRHHLRNGVILVNYHLPDPPGTLEIDIVVLNRNGVYLLEVKHWYGSIEANQVHWRHSSGELRPSPIPSIERKAKHMHSFLVNQGWDNVSAVGLVILSKGNTFLKIDDPNAYKVFGLHDNFIKALTGRAYVYHPKCRKLSRPEIDRLSQTILKTHVKDAKRCVAGYQVQHERDYKHYVELIAKDPEFEGRQVRIKQYDVPAIGSAQELKKAVGRFKRDMAALVEAGRHPNLVMPYQFRRDESSDERYYLILEWNDDQALADRIAAGPIGLNEQLRILKDIATALVHCHKQRVYHRNLSPTSVYLTSEGRVRIGDFDFAKVPTISRTLSQTTRHMLTGRHLAPEQILHAHDVDQRADIFSLGAVWYDMLFRPQSDEVLDRDQIADAPLPDNGKELLQTLVAEPRSERHEFMQAVQKQLESLSIQEVDITSKESTSADVKASEESAQPTEAITEKKDLQQKHLTQLRQILSRLFRGK